MSIKIICAAAALTLAGAAPALAQVAPRGANDPLTGYGRGPTPYSSTATLGSNGRSGSENSQVNRVTGLTEGYASSSQLLAAGIVGPNSPEALGLVSPE